MSVTVFLILFLNLEVFQKKSLTPDVHNFALHCPVLEADHFIYFFSLSMTRLHQFLQTHRQVPIAMQSEKNLHRGLCASAQRCRDTQQNYVNVSALFIT